jgi:5-(carboxyamino)imidazole ribonucleotide synthase
MTRVGVLGAGQLGRMLALAGYPLGLSFRFLDPARGAPAGQIAEQVVARYDDAGRLDDFLQGVDVVTYEFENVPAALPRALARSVPVYPPPGALETSQDRLAEKTLFTRLGVPTASYAAVDSREDLDRALATVGCPAVLKTRRFGYDGKGQVRIATAAEAADAWGRLGGVPLLLESFVPFERELSVLAVRGRDGNTASYPVVENQHSGGILRLSRAPAPESSASLQAEAEEYAGRVLHELKYVGVLAIEFFQQRGRLLANETAPRVHNSGHWTIEGAETSQFENHLRAILGWPLGSTEVAAPSAMVNLIGSLPQAADVLAVPGAHLHVYGKSPRPGRKLGHITVRAKTAAVLEERLNALRTVLGVHLSG